MTGRREHTFRHFASMYSPLSLQTHMQLPVIPHTSLGFPLRNWSKIKCVPSTTSLVGVCNPLIATTPWFYKKKETVVIYLCLQFSFALGISEDINEQSLDRGSFHRIILRRSYP